MTTVAQSAPDGSAVAGATTKHPPSPAGPSRYAALDGMRGIGICWVVFAHLGGTGGFISHDKLVPIAQVGHLGLRLFFVLSGFLITTLLMREYSKTGEISLIAFYIRRSLRIFPAFYVYVLVVALFNWMGVLEMHPDDFFHALTYTMNFHYDRAWNAGHLWSLSVEEQFYMLWPLTLVLAGFRRSTWICAAVILTAPAVRMMWFYWVPDGPRGMGEAFPVVADSIATGCLFAMLGETLGKNKWYMRVLTWRWFGFIFLGAVVINWINFSHAKFESLVGDTALNIAMAMQVDYLVRFPKSNAARIMNFRVATYLGVMSYSIYLWQQIFMNRFSTAFYTQFPQNLIFAFAAAFASHYLVERPLMRVKDLYEERRMRNAKRKPAATVAANIPAEAPGPVFTSNALAP